MSAKTDFYCDGHPTDHDSHVGAKWTEIPYPVGDAKHHVGASPMVYVDALDEAGRIAYHTIYRDNVVPSAFAGELSWMSPLTHFPSDMLHWLGN